MYNSHHLIKHSVVIYRTLQYYILQIKKDCIYHYYANSPATHHSPNVSHALFYGIHNI